MEVVTTPGALGNMAGVELPDNPITREFADFVAAAELASYGSVQGRGARNPMILRPSMQVSVNQQWFGAPACKWNRLRTGPAVHTSQAGMAGAGIGPLDWGL